MAKKKISYEDAISELDQVLAALENGDSTLDESVILFKRGLELIKMCDEQLAKAEGEMKILIDGQLVDFTAE